MYIRLLNLKIENFKGITYREFNFNGKNADIYGDNATGKTTVYDAITWLLFGKDSLGNTQFEIFPLGFDGEQKQRGISPTVTARMDFGGEVIELKRAFRERWSCKRGATEETYDGNETLYFMDGVPVKKYQYEERLETYITEDVFRSLTSTGYFCELPWQERRNILFEMSGVQTDAELMAEEQRFAELCGMLGKLSIDDLVKKLQTERRGIMSVRNELPARIDECQHSIKELADVDFSAAEQALARLENKKEALQRKIVDLGSDVRAAQLRNEIRECELTETELKSENKAYRDMQSIAPAQSDALKTEYKLAAQNEHTAIMRAERLKKDLNALRDAVQGCRERWAKVKSSQLQQQTVCGACGRAFDPQTLAAALERFETEKMAELDKVIAEADGYKAKAAETETELAAAMKDAEEAKEETKKAAEALSHVPTVEIADMPDYAQKRAEIANKLLELRGELSKAMEASTEVIGDCRREVRVLDAEIREQNAVIAKRAQLEKTRMRMEELRKQQMERTDAQLKIDALLQLCDEFIRYKTERIEGDINHMFDLTRWKLFDTQINGAVVPCCEATVNGVPYSSLNNGARINVGMDIINTLSRYYDKRVPLFVDNAESVTQLLCVDTQTVRLIVSEADKELRCGL